MDRFWGIFIAFEYAIASIGLMITIVGIPFGIQTFKLAILALFSFGSRVEKVEESSGCVSLVMNIIWLFIGGIPIALTHLFFGILYHYYRYSVW